MSEPEATQYTILDTSNTIYYLALFLGKSVNEIVNKEGNLTALLQVFQVPEPFIKFINSQRNNAELINMNALFPGGQEALDRDLILATRRLLLGTVPHRIRLRSSDAAKTNGMSNDMLAMIYYLNTHRDVFFKDIDVLEEVDIDMPIGDKWFVPANGHMPLMVEEGLIEVRITTTTNRRQLVDSDLATSIDLIDLAIEISSWSLTINELLEFISKAGVEMDEAFNELLNKEMFMYAHIGVDRFTRYDMPLSVKKWEHTFFEGADVIEAAVDKFLKSDESDRRNAHHLGIGIFGKPGNGKTSAIKAIMNQCRDAGETRQAVVINFNYISTVEHLYNVFYGSKLTKHTEVPQGKRLYIFEDFDTCPIAASRSDKDRLMLEKGDVDGLLADGISSRVKGLIGDAVERIGGDDDTNVNLGDLLNVIDGILEAPGRMIIVTSNHPERIDPALLRPGRIDVRIDLTGSRRTDIVSIIQDYYGVSVRLPERIADYALSGATVMGACRLNPTTEQAVAYLLTQV